MSRITNVGGVRVERVSFYGETRFRFWVKSLWFAPRSVSDGGMYRSIKEAVAAGQQFVGRA